jgi:hypothetical protein
VFRYLFRTVLENYPYSAVRISELLLPKRSFAAVKACFRTYERNITGGHSHLVSYSNWATKKLREPAQQRPDGVVIITDRYRSIPN